MVTIFNRKPRSRQYICLLLSFVLVFSLAGCKKAPTHESYHAFPGKTWARFNILSFAIPVTETEKPWDIYLFARFTPQFSYEKLNFNMVMNTASGEERIKEYEMGVRSPAGSFIVECKGDSCQGTILLKRELLMSKPGILKIEIENLTPRMNTEGVMGVGIRMVQSGK